MGDPSSVVIVGLSRLYEDAWSLLRICGLLLFGRLRRTLNPKLGSETRTFRGGWSRSLQLEFLWSLFPVILVVWLLLPSFELLYRGEEAPAPVLSLLVTGHQWFWHYDYGLLRFDSYITEGLRLLETDQRVVLPVGVPLRILVRGADVIHSWRVPELGVKLDRVPGRLNEASLFLRREGVFYGQCSELCGANHSIIPIRVERVSREDFEKWATTIAPPATTIGFQSPGNNACRRPAGPPMGLKPIAKQSPIAL